MSTAPTRAKPETNAARQDDVSFFMGRGGLRLPKSWLEMPDFDAPAAPVVNLFDVLRDVWRLNGYKTGKVRRHDTIYLPGLGYNVEAILHSQYAGVHDDELAGFATELRDPAAKFKPGWEPTTHQGNENFAISLRPDIDRAGGRPAMTSGRVSLLTARSYFFKVVKPEDGPQGVGTNETPDAYDLEPDADAGSTYSFVGTQRIDLLDEARDGVNEYAAWVAHSLVAEFLSDHSK